MGPLFAILVVVGLGVLIVSRLRRQSSRDDASGPYGGDGYSPVYGGGGDSFDDGHDADHSHDSGSGGWESGGGDSAGGGDSGAGGDGGGGDSGGGGDGGGGGD